MSKSNLYVGLMTGTSIDGLDVALIECDANGMTLLQAVSYPIPDTLATLCQSLCQPGDDSLDSYGRAHQWLGELSAEAVLSLLKDASVSANRIRAIGSHGQTVRHRPDRDHPFTLQLGNAAVIAAHTGIDTVADFRSADMALGGQGAPLVPAFHQWLFNDPTQDQLVLNIGGIANVTWLPAGSAPVLGFDTGPGNTLMDRWCQLHTGHAYDKDGQWAASGKLNRALLASLMTDSYFHRPFPKSTGREYFNADWLTDYLATEASAAEDVQATLAALTCHSIADAIRPLLRQVTNIYVCGGGVHNQYLLEQLRQTLAPHPIHSTLPLGLHPDWVEAACFGWLAFRHLNGATGNLPEVTGASRATVLGSLYPAP